MPRGRRMMDYMMMRDGRNPYGSRGGYVVSSRRGRRDRAMSGDRSMDYAYDRRDYRGGDYEYDSRRGDRSYSEQDMARGRRDYESMGQSDMARGDYGDMRGRSDYAGDMHRSERGGNFHPVEAMGYFTGCYGGGEDMARSGRGRDYADYNYDMRGRGRDYGDYGYDMRGRDYGYDYAGGENLEEEELEHWKKKLMKELDDKDKQFFSKEYLKEKAKQMGRPFDKVSEQEFEVATLMVYTDYCTTLGTSNMDLYLRLAKDWLEDDDVAVKGGEKLAVYYDSVVDPE